MSRTLGLLEQNVALLPPEALIAHIIWRFHDVHRRELPQLIQLARQAETANVIRPPKAGNLSSLLEEISAELEGHMAEEEQLLFPLMLSARSLNLDPPIKHILIEHEQHTALLNRIDDLAKDYYELESNGQTHILATGLKKFVEDLRVHLELENKALYPQFTSRR